MQRRIITAFVIISMTLGLLTVVGCTGASNSKSGSQEEQQTTSSSAQTAQATDEQVPSGPAKVHTLIELPYPTNALEPVISQATVELHHGKHLKGYVDKLNALIPNTKFAQMSLIEIVRQSDGAIFNQAGQTLNHNLYFTQFSPTGGGEPSGNLRTAIDAQFGSFEAFKEQFQQSGTALFGAGWVWLASEPNGTLTITSEANAGNPVTKNLIPILGIDVWEHAYYLDYQNRRADHLKQVWQIIDWNIVQKRYDDRDSFFN